MNLMRKHLLIITLHIYFSSWANTQDALGGVLLINSAAPPAYTGNNNFAIQRLSQHHHKEQTGPQAQSMLPRLSAAAARAPGLFLRRRPLKICAHLL